MAHTPVSPRTVLPPRWWRVPLWCALAFVLWVIVAELAVRQSGYVRPDWYPALQSEIARRPGVPVVVFVGTSRVASVDVGAFAVRAGLPPETIGSNLGQGFSTITSHALGLRGMAARGELRGATVFVEAPAGLPDVSDWRDPWMFAERPYWLTSVLRPGDLTGLWRSRMTVENKIAATVRGIFRRSWIATFHEDIRVEALGAAYGFSGYGPARSRAARSRTDTGDRGRIRDAAMREGRALEARHSAAVDWSRTVVASLAQTVRAGGGRVVFFEMPVTTEMGAAARSPAGQGNVAAFTSAAAAWGAERLTAPAAFGDEEFPDGWHLSLPAGQRFTFALADAWRAQ